MSGYVNLSHDNETLIGAKSNTSAMPNYSSTQDTEAYIYEDDEDEFFQNKSKGTLMFYWALLAAFCLAVVYYFLDYTLGIEPNYIRVPDLVRVESLEPLHHPSSSKRLIVIGDIHGQLKALEKLLKKVDYSSEQDHLLFLGDMVSKGPSSSQVLDFAIEHNASCVRGNHEDTVLNMYAKLHKLPLPRTEPLDSSSTVIAKDAFLPLRTSDRTVAKKLKPRHIEYLGTCPAILKLGPLGFDNTDAVAVHGGLQWQIEHLEEQNPDVVFTLRSLMPPSLLVPSEDDIGEPWSKVWTKKQAEKPKSKRTTVFYGHDARTGLKLRKYTAGLDSGCGNGRKLTAMVIGKDKGIVTHTLSSVKC